MHYIGSCGKVEIELKDPQALPKTLLSYDGVKTVVARFRDGSISATGNVICNRRALYELLCVESDKRAYLKIIGSIDQAIRGNVREDSKDFNNYYTRVENVESFIEKLPATRFYECDGGPYLTGAIIIGCVGDVCNASIHRMMRVGEGFAVRVVPRHLYRMLRERRPLPVAVVLGANPLVELAAAVSPPYGVFELDVAKAMGWGGGTCLTPTYSIPVPCDASIVIEGLIGTGYAPEGPFTDILLLCDRVREEPIFVPQHVYVSYTGRYVWQILPGGTEHQLLMGFPREALIWDNVRRSVGLEPRVRLLKSGGGWLSVVLAFNDIDHAHAKLAALAAIAAHPSVKFVIVTLSDINIDNEVDVNWALATRLDPQHDVMVINEIRGSSLDPTSRDGTGSKIVMIALPRGDKSRFLKPRIIET